MDDQSKLLHHFKDIVLDDALPAELGKDVINKFHTEDTCFLHFFPQFTMPRFLERKDNIKSRKQTKTKTAFNYWLPSEE